MRALVVGDEVGALVVGDEVRDEAGALVVGDDDDGDEVGALVVGDCVGEFVGNAVGCGVTAFVGLSVAGWELAAFVG